jgi:hypothetical protein
MKSHNFDSMDETRDLHIQWNKPVTTVEVQQCLTHRDSTQVDVMEGESKMVIFRGQWQHQWGYREISMNGYYFIVP